MSNSGTAYLHILLRIAKVGRWLFWISFIYAIYYVLIMIASSGVPMNPVARGSLWGRFRWHFPGVFELIHIVVPLFFLYFFQSRLGRGLRLSNDSLIREGLHFLYGYLIVKVILLMMSIIFDDAIQPNWWGF